MNRECPEHEGGGMGVGDDAELLGTSPRTAQTRDCQEGRGTQRWLLVFRRLNECGHEKWILWRSEYRGHSVSDREPERHQRPHGAQQVSTGLPQAAERMTGFVHTKSVDCGRSDQVGPPQGVGVTSLYLTVGLLCVLGQTF